MKKNGKNTKHWLVLVASLLLLVVAVVEAPGLGRLLDPGGFDVIGSSANANSDVLSTEFDVVDGDVVAVVQAKESESPSAVRSEADRIAASVAKIDGVKLSVGPRAGGDALVSADGRAALVIVTLAGGDAEQQRVEPSVVQALRSARDGVLVGGEVEAQVQGQTIAEADLLHAELLTLPVVAVLLGVFYRGVLAALIPVGVGALAIGLATLSLRLLSSWMTVNLFALNVVTFLGLGLAIDYSLFILQRYREDLSIYDDVEVARRETLRTAGRAVVYSAAAVAASLLSLWLFPIPLLRSIALGGTIVVGMALGSALVVLPAALTVAGRRLAPRRGGHPPKEGTWSRLARVIIRHRVVAALALVALLVTLGAPALRLRPASTDAASFPGDSEVYEVQDLIVREFPKLGRSTVSVLVKLDGADPSGELVAVEQKLSGLAGVVEVVGPASSLETLPDGLPAEARKAATEKATRAFIRGDDGYLRVASAYAAGSPESDDLIAAIGQTGSDGTVVIPTGPAAAARESHQEIITRLPWVVVAVGGSTFVILLLAFGTLLIPLKAVVMNALSLTASFGALVFIFQDGRLTGVLSYVPQGSIDPLVPILVFAIVFGLSMDYEIFLLSRIREDYLKTKDTNGAVARGLQSTAGIITRAAILLIVVLAAFATGRLLFLRELGIAMIIAVVVDATIVRMALVPATMALLGDANWWAPRAFQRWWERLGIAAREPLPGEGPSEMVSRRP